MCTRIFWNNNSLSKAVGRTMDWPTTTDPILTVLPRGMSRNGGYLGEDQIVKENPAEWTSRYGSVVVTIYGVGTVDGINEKGLAGHMLYLSSTDFGEREPAKPGIQASLWLQYLLDCAANVSEALELMGKIQVVMASFGEFKTFVHLAIEDASGDSAILEFVDGELTIHHGEQYRIMTNDPIYNEQLANRARYDFKGATRNTPLPGNVNPVDRFIRASYFLSTLPEPKDERVAIASILSIARNVSVPFGAPNNKPGSLYNTEYRTAIDLNHRRYFFELTTSPNVIWLELDRLNFEEGSPVMGINPDQIDLSGDVSDKFKKLDNFLF